MVRVYARRECRKKFDLKLRDRRTKTETAIILREKQTKKKHPERQTKGKAAAASLDDFTGQGRRCFV